MQLSHERLNQYQPTVADSWDVKLLCEAIKTYTKPKHNNPGEDRKVKGPIKRENREAERALAQLSSRESKGEGHVITRMTMDSR